MDAAERWQILRLHVEDQIPLAALARDTGVGLRTLERWHARFRTEGYTGLGTRRRADAGSHRLPAELVSLVEGLALSKPRPAIITIHRKVSAICEEQGWPVPSYGVVRAIVADLDPGMVTLALEGPASYRDKYELALRRRAEHLLEAHVVRVAEREHARRVAERRCLGRRDDHGSGLRPGGLGQDGAREELDAGMAIAPMDPRLYLPLARSVERLASLIGLLQQGRIAVYLLYSFVTLIAVLVVVKQ